eukprot:scaffold447_cov307-Pinguiococcus_pyrenoidosus.AAC.77
MASPKLFSDCDAKKPRSKDLPRRIVEVARLVLVTRGLLLLTDLEVLASLDHQVALALALLALQTQGDLLRGLGLLVEDRLGLPAIAHLLVVITPLPLREVGRLARLMGLLQYVLLSLGTFTICFQWETSTLGPKVAPITEGLRFPQLSPPSGGPLSRTREMLGSKQSPPAEADRGSQPLLPLQLREVPKAFDKRTQVRLRRVNGFS